MQRRSSNLPICIHQLIFTSSASAQRGARLLMINPIFSALSRTKLPAVILASTIGLTACVSPIAGPSGNYAAPIGNAPVTANPTPYSAALVCLGNYARTKNIRGPRVAVGRILDYTGKSDFEGGRQVTQGASLMAISAFAKSGAIKACRLLWQWSQRARSGVTCTRRWQP